MNNLDKNIARITAWKRADLDRNRASGRNYIRRLRKELIAGYGGKCECCGAEEFEFMTLDHRNGGGNAHRKTETPRNLYIRLRREGFPRKDYGLLCWNCNAARGIYGTCPHQSKKLQDAMREQIHEEVA